MFDFDLELLEALSVWTTAECRPPEVQIRREISGIYGDDTGASFDSEFYVLGRTVVAVYCFIPTLLNSRSFGCWKFFFASSLHTP
jgi:hypothetical protein